MATLSSNNPTLLDLAKRKDPDGSIAAIVEILNETNEILDDMAWLQGNLETGHLTTIRTGLPTPTWRKMYGGIQPAKSTTVQVKDSCGMLEAMAEVDKALADLNGNTAEFRLSESRPHIESMNQEIADTVFYGNETTEPEAFTGLAPRFNSLAAASGENILDAGGSGSDNGSLWLVVWGPNTVHGIVPKGSTAGIQMKDFGEVVIENVDGAGGRMVAYRTHFRWDAGLTVRDWRFVVRVANIDKSLLTRVYTSGGFSTGANLPDLMLQAMRKVPKLGMGRPAFYMSRDMATWVSRQTMAMGQGGMVTVDPASPNASVAGSIQLTERFHGIPMRRVDALSADETQVT